MPSFRSVRALALRLAFVGRQPSFLDELVALEEHRQRPGAVGIGDDGLFDHDGPGLGAAHFGGLGQEAGGHDREGWPIALCHPFQRVESVLFP